MQILRYHIFALLGAYCLLATKRILAIKAGSQSDAKPCVALIRETHKFITKIKDGRTQRRGPGMQE